MPLAKPVTVFDKLVLLGVWLIIFSTESYHVYVITGLGRVVVIVTVPVPTRGPVQIVVSEMELLIHAPLKEAIKSHTLLCPETYNKLVFLSYLISCTLWLPVQPNGIFPT